MRIALLLLAFLVALPVFAQEQVWGQASGGSTFYGFPSGFGADAYQVTYDFLRDSKDEYDPADNAVFPPMLPPSRGAIYWATPTSTSNAAGVPIKAAGTTAAQGDAVQVTQATTNRLTYTGADTQTFVVTATVAVSSPAPGGTASIIYLAKNGTEITETAVDRDISSSDTGAIAVHAVIELAANDYVEVWCETSDGDDLTIESGVLSMQSVENDSIGESPWRTLKSGTFTNDFGLGEASVEHDAIGNTALYIGDDVNDNSSYNISARDGSIYLDAAGDRDALVEYRVGIEDPDDADVWLGICQFTTFSPINTDGTMAAGATVGFHWLRSSPAQFPRLYTLDGLVTPITSPTIPNFNGGAAGTWVKYGIKLTSRTTVEFYINDVQVGTSTLSTSLTYEQKPCFGFVTTGTPGDDMWIDYIKVYQTRI